MKISFLGQGFDPTSPNSVGNKIIEFLSMNQFDSFLGIAAFASPAGVKGLSTHLNQARPNFRDLSIIVGIDQNGTSVEALEEIVNLGIRSHIFYQKEAPIFHPKIYLFEGRHHIKLILGSSNLTANGLFSNHEASLMAEFDSTDTDGIQLLREIKGYYSTLFNFSDPNLFEITRDNIDSFITDGVIDREPIRVQQNRKIRQSVTRSINVPNRQTPPIPPEFRMPRRSRSATSEQIINTSPEGEEILIEKGQLIWSKSTISRTDAQIVPPHTNPTGHLKLTQASFKISRTLIAHRTYFRNTAFHNLAWNSPRVADPEFEETYANFAIFIDDTPFGPFKMRISHDPKRDSGQSNVPSWLHWGSDMAEILRTHKIKNKCLNLFSSDKPEEFVIEIN